MKKLILLTMLLVVGMSGLFSQGATRSAISGNVLDSNGEGLIGASVVIVHTPTGTRYGTVTDLSGNYNFSNLRVGGPYTVETSYVGYETTSETGIYLRLGEVKTINRTLSENGVMIDEIAIVASSGSAGTNSGASTKISAEDITMMPTLNRDLKDFTRLTPQARESFGGGISIGGQNNRYNAIYIDGAVNNDVFGLAANGQNGGQTGISPISIDAIDQIQVVISPFDVSYGGFTGGGINAVTKSGTNKMQGSAYYFMKNQNLVGKTAGIVLDRAGTTVRTKVADFTEATYGFTLGGPIVKDKVFFFVNAEIQDDETPVPFTISTYEGNTDEAGLVALQNYVSSQYGYDTGSFGDKIDKLQGTKLLGKLDFNINQNNQLTIRHQYTRGVQTDVFGSSSNSINYANNGIYFPSTTNSSALELNSTIGANKSNKLILGFTSVNDDRDVLGDIFPRVIIDDGEGRIVFGGEEFSTGNALEQKIFTITDNFKIYKGNHTLTLGTHNEFMSFYNLFIAQNYGSYNFDSVEDFYTGIASDYNRSYSLVDNITGDGSAAAAEFSAMQLGFYAQDEWSVNNQFTLTGGLRVDIPILTTDPGIDPSFNTTTLPLLSAQYDLQGAEGGKAPSGQIMLSPRLGLEYKIDATTTIRGGLGIFTSRIPFVWPGGMFTNNGITIGQVRANNLDGDITFIADPNQQYTNPNFTVPSGEVNLFSKDFKFPQVFRASLALDKTLGNGWSTTLEGMYTKTLNNVFYQNVNSDTTVKYNWTNGQDDRPVYTRTNIDPTYSAVYLASNTSEGSAYNVTASVNKDFDFGLNLYAAYSIGDATSIFEGTSSQNSSQWRGAFSVDGRNNAELGRSDFALGSRIIAALGYGIDWGGSGNYNTNISLFYNGQSGELYSYVYDDRNINNEAGSTSREYHLIYVPTDVNDIKFVDITDSDNNVINSADAQAQAFDKFIEQDDYLSTRRGQYAEKNGSRTPFQQTVDLRIAQDLGTNIGGYGHKLQLTLDIFNVGNMINNDWGAVYNNPFNYRILDYVTLDADGTTPLFKFTETDLGNDRYGVSEFFSRWRGRIGVRYTFN